MKKVQLRSLWSLGLVFIALGIVSCGRGTTLPVTTTPAVNTGNVQALTVLCQQRGGAMIQIGAAAVCRYSDYVVRPGAVLVESYTRGLPRVNPSDPSGAFGRNMGIRVRPGNKVTINSDSFWGLVNYDTTSLLGGLFNFTFYSVNCQMVTGDGKSTSNGTMKTVEGLPPGLMISDQTKAYFVGENGAVTVEYNGNLFLGFNTYDGACGRLMITQLRIDRCEDALGQTYRCP